MAVVRGLGKGMEIRAVAGCGQDTKHLDAKFRLCAVAACAHGRAVEVKRQEKEQP